MISRENTFFSSNWIFSIWQNVKFKEKNFFFNPCYNDPEYLLLIRRIIQLFTIQIQILQSKFFHKISTKKKKKSTKTFSTNYDNGFNKPSLNNYPLKFLFPKSFHQLKTLLIYNHFSLIAGKYNARSVSKRIMIRSRMDFPNCYTRIAKIQCIFREDLLKNKVLRFTDFIFLSDHTRLFSLTRANPMLENFNIIIFFQ